MDHVMDVPQYVSRTLLTTCEKRSKLWENLYREKSKAYDELKRKYSELQEKEQDDRWRMK